MLNVLDLFAGIGGFALGLERAGGFHTAAFCENDPDAQRVLKKHWPDTPIYGDVATLTKDQLDADGIAVDVITAGFPCQDISYARTGSGQGLGDALDGERSGLWFQVHRIIAEIGPKVVLLENVAALRTRGLDVVLSGLDALGYDAEWHCILASNVGAPHPRDRVWIIAYPRSAGLSGPVLNGAALPLTAPTQFTQLGDLAVQSGPEWACYPHDLRVGDGVSHWAHRLKQLGNALVPQIPEIIGRAYNASVR
jgi:DNA (cytosine-5)-methyltransferase 1